MTRFGCLIIAMVVAGLLTSANAQVPLTTATCTNSNLNGGIVGQRVVVNQTVFVRRLATIADQAMDDFGNSAPGDRLELFCVSTSQGDSLGLLAACLSNEGCPWR